MFYGSLGRRSILKTTKPLGAKFILSQYIQLSTYNLNRVAPFFNMKAKVFALFWPCSLGTRCENPIGKFLSGFDSFHCVLEAKTH